MSVDRHIELARAWLSAAETDLRLSSLVMPEGYFAHVCFSCQQAAEKALKAYLLAHKRGLVRTHFLPRLLQECLALDQQFAQLTNACVVLTGYYTDTRYPDSPETLDGYDADMAGEALLLARQVVALVRDATHAVLDLGSSA